MANPWTTVEFARTVWPGAPSSDDRLQQLIDAGYEACVEYAPALADGAQVPQRYREANVLAARAIYTAARQTADGLGLSDGSTDLALPTPVLGSQVLQLLRPPATVVLG